MSFNDGQLRNEIGDEDFQASCDMIRSNIQGSIWKNDNKVDRKMSKRRKKIKRLSKKLKKGKEMSQKDKKKIQKLKKKNRKLKRAMKEMRYKWMLDNQRQQNQMELTFCRFLLEQSGISFKPYSRKEPKLPEWEVFDAPYKEVKK